MKSKGSVYLVGAGPGDVGLLTLRGAELLRQADVVLHDGYASAEILHIAARTTEVLRGGSFGEGTPCANLPEAAISRAREGRRVVWLYGADFGLSGQGTADQVALSSAGVPCEVVPGVSALATLPACAGIPLALPGSPAFAVADVRSAAPEKAGIDLASLARSPGSKVLLSSAEHVATHTATLVAEGLPGQTPAAVVQEAGTSRQKVAAGSLETLSAQVRDKGLTGPVVLVIGEGVPLQTKLNAFEKRSLFGQRVVVTRSRDQAGEMTRLLLERGAIPLVIPVIKISPPSDRETLIEALLGLNAYDWLVFTSPNGVKQFFEYFFKSFQDMRDIGGVRIAAVGPATAACLRQFHLQVDVIPDEYVAVKIVKAIAAFESIENLRVCLLRAEVANRDLPMLLEEKGAIVDDVGVYKTEPETDDALGAGASLLANGADWLTFTSGSTVEHFHARFNLPELLKRFPTLRTASIGPETSKALTVLELTPHVEAREHTVEGLIRAVEKVLGH